MKDTLDFFKATDKTGKRNYTDKVSKFYLKQVIIFKKSLDQISCTGRNDNTLDVDNRLELLNIPESELTSQWTDFVRKFISKDNPYYAHLMISPPTHKLINKFSERYTKKNKNKSITEKEKNVSEITEAKEYHSDIDSMSSTKSKRKKQVEVWHACPLMPDYLILGGEKKRSTTFIKARINAIENKFKQEGYNFDQYVNRKNITLNHYTINGHFIIHQSILLGLFTKNQKANDYTSLPPMEISKADYPFTEDFLLNCKTLKDDHELVKLLKKNPEAEKQLTEKEKSANNNVITNKVLSRKPNKKMDARMIGTPIKTYIGNSINYINWLEDLLDKSPSFNKAKRIYDITTGSGAITFYFAQIYRDKTFYMSDINPHLIKFYQAITTDKNDLIEKFRKHWDAIIVNNNYDRELMKKDYAKLLATYNECADKQGDPGDFWFLISTAADHLLYTSVGLSGSIRAIKPGTKPDSFIKALERAYQILMQGNIIIAQKDINDLFNESTPDRAEDEFYIFTPSHVKDVKKTYFRLTELAHIQKFIENAGKEDVNFIMTLGDNNKFRTPNLNFVFNKQMIRLIKMSSAHENKRLIIYASKGVFSKQDELVIRKETSDLLRTKMRLLASLIPSGDSNENTLKETYVILSHDLELLEGSTEKYDPVLDKGYYNDQLNIDAYYHPETEMELENGSSKDEVDDDNNLEAEILLTKNNDVLSDTQTKDEELMTMQASKKQKTSEDTEIKITPSLELSRDFANYCRKSRFGGFAHPTEASVVQQNSGFDDPYNDSNTSSLELSRDFANYCRKNRFGGFAHPAQASVAQQDSGFDDPYNDSNSNNKVY